MSHADRRKNRPTILLTGATGFIGSHLLPRLRRTYRVITLGRNPVQGVAHIPFDLASTDRLPLAEIPRGAILLHAAAAVRRSRADDRDPEDFRRINVEGTERLLHALEDRLPGYILFVSTTDVYARSAAPIAESSALGPETAYAESKLEAEIAVLRFGSDRGIPTAVARLGNIYGPGEEAFGKLIPAAIQAALSHQPVPVFGEGRALRDLLSVDDAAAAILHMLSRKATWIFNVVSGTAIKVLETIATINALARNSAGIQYTGNTAREFDRVFTPGALRGLGWAPKTGLADGLKREIEAALERRPMLAIDLDGTLLDYWPRMYGLYREYLAAKGIPPASFAAYRKEKRGGASEAAIAAAALKKTEVSQYLSWKRRRIEEWSLLSTDTLPARSLEFLAGLNRRFRVVLVTGRQRPQLVRRQLQQLSILNRFFRILCVEGDRHTAKAAALRKLQRKSAAPLWYIGDSETDIAAARHAGVRVAVVTWGLRSAAFLKGHKPDRLIRRVDTPDIGQV